jgi:hypothetical protein
MSYKEQGKGLGIRFKSNEETALLKLGDELQTIKG